MTVPDPPINAQIQRLPAEAEPSLIRQILDNDGAAILQGAFSGDVIRKLNGELDPAAQAADVAAKKTSGLQFHKHSKYVFNLPGISNTFRTDILNSPVLNGVAENIFEDRGDYWVTAAFLRELHPGNNAQNLHRDEGSHPILQYQMPGAPAVTISFIIALTDFKKNNGGTRVILGSHKWQEIGNPTFDQAVSAEMKAGDVLVMAQGMVHAGGEIPANVPDVRRACLVFFSISQLTPFETYMTMPRAIVESMTPLAQRLIGWRSVMSVPSNKSVAYDESESKVIEEAKQVLHPNLLGLHNAGSKLLQDALQLKANVSLGN
ncbi:Verruculogen synthase [Aspergillus spinulosporus]